MEHAYSTAITLPAKALDRNLEAFESVTAHEFFHLWDVKRIRPQSLQPIDYTRENYTRALWFSEGVDSSAADSILLQAGLLDERHYLDALSRTITGMENRPARATQSVEQSSLDAWLEKYPYYGVPGRSISYYDKGELLGVLLDLRMRAATQDRVSLQTLFRWMNQHYAKRGKYFGDSAGIREAAEELTHASLAPFFADYVSGVREIPWDEFFAYVGLRVLRTELSVAESGFVVTQKFDQGPVVVQVDPGSDAERAGLQPDDTITVINGTPAGRDFENQIDALGPGANLRLQITRKGNPRELQWTLGSRKQAVYQLSDVPEVSSAQKRHRALWLFNRADPAQ
jgi:predicted metalloprotease with PDZ domain